MKFDDLIGILFLLLFIIGPALKGLFKPSEPLIEVELPDFEPEAATPSSRPQQAGKPAGTNAQKASPPAQPQRPRQVIVAPPAGEKTTVAPAASLKQAAADRADKLPDGGRRRVRKLTLETGRRAVLTGMLWHEILSEPVALKRLKRFRRGAKLK